MKLKYQCPICGTPLRYEGLCWKCQSEQNRKEIMEWTTEQIKEKQNGLIKNIDVYKRQVPEENRYRI